LYQKNGNYQNPEPPDHNHYGTITLGYQRLRSATNQQLPQSSGVKTDNPYETISTTPRTGHWTRTQTTDDWTTTPRDPNHYQNPFRWIPDHYISPIQSPTAVQTFSPRTTPPRSPVDRHYQFAKERPSTTRKLSEREVEKLWSSQNKFELPENLQEYEGMQLDDPSNMPDLWEGPLPVPQPTSPFKRTPVEDITEDLLIEPRTPNPEPEMDYPDDLYMEENLEPEPPDPHPTDQVYMDTKQDPEPLKLPALPTVEPPPKAKPTKSSPSGGGGGYFPQTKTCKTPKKKIPPPVQPKMKVGGLDKLREYNQEFKQWQLRLVGRVLDNKETIKAYVTGLQSKILTVLLKDGYKFKEIKTLAKSCRNGCSKVREESGTGEHCRQTRIGQATTSKTQGNYHLEANETAV
jgi:hypothetical protein